MIEQRLGIKEVLQVFINVHWLAVMILHTFKELMARVGDVKHPSRLVFIVELQTRDYFYFAQSRLNTFVRNFRACLADGGNNDFKG